MEKEIIADIARRVKKTGRYTETAELMAKSMIEQGYSAEKTQAEVMKMLRADTAYRNAVAENTKAYKREVQNIINQTVKDAKKAGNELVAEAGSMAWNNDLSMWQEHGVDLKKPNSMSELLAAFQAQTAGQLKNLTRTMGFKNTALGVTGVLNAYQREMDLALLKVATGIFSYDKAVNDCVHRLAQSGLRSVNYESGRTYQLDTAVRMSVRTGLSQLAGKIMESNLAQTGQDLVITSQHMGSRPEHAPWQNKVFSYSGKNKKYPDFFKETGYGTAIGLKGVNCTHDFYPFWEGASIIPEDIKEPDSVIINGKEYNYYQATQQQRKMERDIRATKREIEAQRSISGSTTELQSKLRKQTADYKRFSIDAGLRPKENRLRVEKGTSRVTNKKLGKDSDVADIKFKTQRSSAEVKEDRQAEVMKMLRADTAYRNAVAENTKAYKREVQNIINQTVKDAKKAGNELVAEAGSMAWNNDLSMWQEHGVDLKKPNSMSQLLVAFQTQTAGQLKNLTRTMGFKNTVLGVTGVLYAYQREMDLALLKIATGMFSYDKAVNDCVHRLAQSGLRSVNYESGRTYQLDTAVRMSVRTGLSQLTGKIMESNLAQTGHDLVITSQHMGSRPEHAPWQNKVFSYSGKNKKYPDFFKETGYGTAIGLKGVNCTHDFYPFWEGASIIPEDIKEPDSVIVNGKEYNYYQAIQQQRKMERDIRATKREIEAQRSISGSTTELQSKLRKQTANYKRFSADVGLRPKENRLRVEKGASHATNKKLGKDSSVADIKFKTQRSSAEVKEDRITAIKSYRLRVEKGASHATNKKLGKDSSVADIKFKTQRSSAEVKEDRITAIKSYSSLTPKVQKKMSDVTFELGCAGSGCDYKNGIIYTALNAEKEDIDHEVGHLIEYRMMSRDDVDRYKRYLVENVSSIDVYAEKYYNDAGDEIEIMIVHGSRFVSEYQGRIYANSVDDAFNPDGSIKTELMLETISEPFRLYQIAPKSRRIELRQ